MAEITMYSTQGCGYCQSAKNLLERKGIAFTTIRVDVDPGQRDIMIQRSGRRSVPQIFIDALHIGGFDELSAMERSGKLDALLQA